jgi:LysR family transcriptional regulator for metE and metH
MTRFLESSHLRLVAEVARTESVTRAADRLHVTQSAVSHQLRDLEHRLGTALFIRSGRRMVPTPAGRALAETAGGVLASIERVEAHVAQMARHAAGELRVCTHCYTGYSWLPPLVAELRRRYPGFTLQIAPEYTVDPIAALLDAELDLAIMNDESDDRRLRHRELFDDEHVVVVPASHRWATRSFVAPDELAGEELYLYSRSLEHSFLMRQVFRPLGITPGRVTYLQLSEGILAMVRAGMGVTVLPRWSLATALAAGDISAIRISAAGVFRKWYAVTLADLAPTPFLEAFVDLLSSAAPEPRRLAARGAPAAATRPRPQRRRAHM